MTLFVVACLDEVSLERFAQALRPYTIVALSNFSDVLETLDGLDSFGPINQLILERAQKFSGFSLSSYSCAIARHRWLRGGLCDISYDSGRFFDHPSTTMFLWRGDWPWWPSCHDKAHDSQALLEKRIVSQTCRFVFFAGIEGTGHHVWQILLPYLNPFKNWSDALSTELYDGHHRLGFFSTYNESIRSNSAIRVMQLMADAERSVRKQGGGIVPLNVLCENTSGMMSFPNFLGPDRAIQNPDIHALAKVAEDAGIDLRIVLLVRHPTSAVRSAMKRNFEPDVMHAIKKYTSSLALLSAQLNLIDPSFIACWKYETPNAGIADLLSFMGSRQNPKAFRQVVAKQYRRGADQILDLSAERNAALQTATAMHNKIVAKYCKPRLVHSGH